ncbi:MAG: glycosyltransferase involved in cell wall biosynthesis [Alteromonas naphthalenivorans]|jgi:glycosyltransferase involved in cell wall biosynthesis
MILYLRTDICKNNILSGGSIGHSIGVIGKLKKYSKVIIYSSVMQSIFKQQKDIIFKELQVWPIFIFLRWRFNYLRWRLECFFSTVFFFCQIFPDLKKYDYEFIYQRYSILNFTGVLLSKYKKISLILEYNGSEMYWFMPSKNDPWYKRWFGFSQLSYWVEDLNLKHASLIVAVSQALKDDLVDRGIDSKKILVNPNGVEEQTFSGEKLMKERMTIRQKYNLENSVAFGFIGTFGHWHGIPMLEKIIPQICDNYPQAKFLLIGDGSLRESLEQAVKKYINNGQVILTGRIDQHLAPEYLAACDAYLCPTAPNQDGTRFFGSPTKLFEYMSMAKPVIASDLEQLSEVLAPAIKVTKNISTISLMVKNQVGILVEPLNVQGFVKACELCLHMSEQERKKLGKNAREKILKNYTWQKHVERILQKIY